MLSGAGTPHKPLPLPPPRAYVALTLTPLLAYVSAAGRLWPRNVITLETDGNAKRNTQHHHEKKTQRRDDERRERWISRCCRSGRCCRCCRQGCPCRGIERGGEETGGGTPAPEEVSFRSPSHWRRRLTSRYGRKRGVRGVGGESVSCYSPLGSGVCVPVCLCFFFLYFCGHAV